jgi:hypothetical protein
MGAVNILCMIQGVEVGHSHCTTLELRMVVSHWLPRACMLMSGYLAGIWSAGH